MLPPGGHSGNCSKGRWGGAYRGFRLPLLVESAPREELPPETPPGHLGRRRQPRGSCTGLTASAGECHVLLGPISHGLDPRRRGERQHLLMLTERLRGSNSIYPPPPEGLALAAGRTDASQDCPRMPTACSRRAPPCGCPLASAGA